MLLWVLLGYLDVGGGLVVVGQADWACDCDGCEQHCGQGRELHVGGCWSVGG